MAKLLLQGVEIPLPHERITDFCTPDWDELLRFYPAWRRKVVELRGDPYPIQPYMLGIAKELARLGADKSDDQILKRYFSYYGTMHFAAFVARYSNG